MPNRNLVALNRLVNNLVYGHAQTRELELMILVRPQSTRAIGRFGVRLTAVSVYFPLVIDFCLLASELYPVRNDSNF